MTIRKIAKAAITTAAILAVTFTVGCSKKSSCAVCVDDTPAPITPHADAALVTGGDTAWVDLYPIGSRDGFILSADGSYVSITDTTGVWAVIDSGKVQAYEGKLKVISGHFYVGIEPLFTMLLPATYSVSETGDTLRITEGGVTDVFVKEAGVVPVAATAPAKSRAGLGKKAR